MGEVHGKGAEPDPAPVWYGTGTRSFSVPAQVVFS